MGSSDFAVPTLVGLAHSGHEMVAVYTRPDKPSGRGLSVVESPVKRVAGKLGCRVQQVENFNNAVDVANLNNLNPDVFIVASFGIILPTSVLDIPHYGCLNLHPSLLPRYRGPTPISAAIISGDHVTGTSVMLIEKKVDSGPILAQAKVHIEPSDTTQSLTEKLAQASADLLIEVLPKWFASSIMPAPQKDEDATYTKMLRKSDGELDWRLSAIELWRRVRAFYPWPVGYTKYSGKILRIFEALPLSRQLDKLGRVVDLGCGDVGVQTGDGVLKLAKVQLEGKNEMGISEFVRGHRGFIGSLLPS